MSETPAQLAAGWFDSREYTGLEELSDLYAVLEKETARAVAVHGISCPAGCIRCCTIDQSGIEASVLELIPLALYAWDRGEAPVLLERLETTPSRCVLLDDTGSCGGGCAGYPFRPLMCRLFGFSVLSHAKAGLVHYACPEIKESEAGRAYGSVCAGAKACGEAADSVHLPYAAALRLQVNSLNPLYGTLLMGVNDALSEALRIVGLRKQFGGT